MTSPDSSAADAGFELYDPLAEEAVYPYQDLLGFRITEWAHDFAKVEMDVAPCHGNRYGIPHGGVHASLLDTAMGFAASFCPYRGRVRRAMTLSLNVNYLGQPKGTRMIATAKVVGGGRSSFFAEGEIRDDLGNLLATGSAAMRWRGNGGDPMGDPR